MLEIGIASYRNPDKLRATVASIEAHTTGDWRLRIIHNASGDAEDEQAQRIALEAAERNPRIELHCTGGNIGYVGAVNYLLANSSSEFVAYCDNDIEILTPGWNEKMIEVMRANPEVGWAFPGAGHYGFWNGRYHECLWNAGYCWILRSDAADKVYEEESIPQSAAIKGRARECGCGYFCTCLGHHEEVDYMIRLRLAGFQVACRPDVRVIHHETATHADSALHKPGGRIHDGVVRWMNKWNRYFCGDQLQYSMTAYDPRALRYTDWPPCALYMERMTLATFPEWNRRVDVVAVPNVGKMDAIRILKPSDAYIGRAI